MSDLTREQIVDWRNEICPENGWVGKDIAELHTICEMALLALKDEPEGWVSEERIAIAAKVIADSPLIDAPKLPAECWHGLARAVLAAK